MKAPDKIYLGIDDMGSGYVYNLSLDNNGHPEYIRKDTLLEWLEGKVNLSYGVATDAFVEVIDKLKSL